MGYIRNTVMRYMRMFIPEVQAKESECTESESTTSVCAVSLGVLRSSNVQYLLTFGWPGCTSLITKIRNVWRSLSVSLSLSLSGCPPAQYTLLLAGPHNILSLASHCKHGSHPQPGYVPKLSTRIVRHIPRLARYHQKSDAAYVAEARTVPLSAPCH
jgi:hypothetical protein